MKQVEIEFESNANATGRQQFRRLKHAVNSQGKNVYIYIRTHAQGKYLGKVFGYETFIPSITKAGTVQTFPNGSTQTIEEDTENYPGASSFGKSAHFCNSMANAEKKFAEMMGQVIEEEKLAVKIPDPPKEIKLPKGKIPDIIIPVGEFTIDILAQHNKVSYQTARNGLQFFLHDRKVKLAKEQRVGNSKRPTKFFTKIL